MPNSENQALIRTSPEEQGISSAAILAFIKAVETSEQELHSFMLLRHGVVVAEAWWKPYGAQIPHMMFSLSKSFTSTAVGIAITEGYFTVDDPILSFFPDEAPHKVSEYLAEMRVKHLLSMSSGHDVRTFPFMYEQSDGNWARGFFEVPVVYKPGTKFVYNTGASYILSELVQRTTGMTLMDYLTPRLFEPLGIEGASWQSSPSGVNLGGIGLSIKTEDIARFGQLYLQKGIWQGKRILSEAWIKEATSAQVSNGDNANSDWTQGYAYQFWRCQHGLYRGDGSFGQFCIVMDEYDAVLAITSAAKDMQAVMTLAWAHLLPAMKTEILEKDVTAHEMLIEKSASLNFPPIQAQATSSMAEYYSGKAYRVETNSFGIESLRIEFTESDATLSLKTGQDDERIIAGHGRWQAGQASLFNEIWLSASLPLVASGAWLDKNRYEMVIRLYETPYIYTLSFQFEGDTLSLRVQINVSLETTDPQIITATRL